MGFLALLSVLLFHKNIWGGMDGKIAICMGFIFTPFLIYVIPVLWIWIILLKLIALIRSQELKIAFIPAFLVSYMIVLVTVVLQ
jgi:hypothetical protein